ncbi:hypothetical protein HPP92_024414 [Vanilla planifolia]|uniref:Hexosyltransferase n=1 Tax=Vanilla planifolia TaxID=51239 RepID=A0A835UEN2_VANPL|nr:hypothetical protein HPP92_024414 [Vanilla planifolia]
MAELKERLAFFKAAYALFDSDFYVKADDDIYLRPDRLSLLLAKDRVNPQTYLGCMKKGPVFTDPKLKCNEDVTIGAWMLAMNVNHENNKALFARLTVLHHLLLFGIFPSAQQPSLEYGIVHTLPRRVRACVLRMHVCFLPHFVEDYGSGRIA